MKLLIAIPALNEEKSICGIIERTLAARDAIKQSAGLEDVEITVVSDGSTDQTVELAARYKPQIQLIVFKKNRGYGAAIKKAWKRSTAELLGFLDADGTCDPLFFADLCRQMESSGVDIVLGSRMNVRSRMPVVRRLGNFIFASLLSFFSSQKIRDTASGMRVVRRSCLDKILPLPDGMHFTPAMSARAILSRDIRIDEIDMPYEEREGESKLRVLKDGLRFLRVIVETAMLYRPERILSVLGGGCFLAAALLMIYPVAYYVQRLELIEWMIYRFVVSALLGTAACLCLCAGHISAKIVKIALSRKVWSDRDQAWLGNFFQWRLFWLIPVSQFLAGVLVVLPSIASYLGTGHVYEHWSRFLAMSFLFSVGMILSVTKMIDFALDLLAARLSYLSRAHEHTTSA